MTTWKIAVTGLESRDYTFLETAIDLASGLESGNWELIENLEMAHVIIADFDSNYDQAAIAKYMSEQSDRIIIQYLSSDNTDRKENTSEITLSPPLSYKNVTTLLTQLEPELTKVQQQNQKEEEQSPPTIESMVEVEEINPVDIAKHKIDWLSDEDSTQEPVLMEITSPVIDNPGEDNSNITTQAPLIETFVADTRLLGLIANVIKGGKTTLIRHQNYPELRIFPDNGWFVSTGSLDSFPEMFREPGRLFSLTPIDEEIKDELFNGRLPQSLWKLLFAAALFGSEGRLLDHLKSDNFFHLMHTPYFGMIPHTADHIIIAEYMVNNNSKIETIHNDTKIDIETIIDFCNACDAIQLLQNEEASESVTNDLTDTDPTEPEDDTTVKSEVTRDSEKQKKPGLINSLWSNLTKTS